jgi:hypothetical protein
MISLTWPMSGDHVHEVNITIVNGYVTQARCWICGMEPYEMREQ